MIKPKLFLCWSLPKKTVSVTGCDQGVVLLVSVSRAVMAVHEA